MPLRNERKLQRGSQSWFCRVYFRRVPDATTLLRWANTIRPVTLHAPLDRVVDLAWLREIGFPR